MNANERQTDEHDDAHFVRTIRDAYSAPGLTPARRAAIDGRVWERVERGGRFRFVAGMTVSAALAASLVLVVRANRVTTEPSDAPAKVASVSPAPSNALAEVASAPATPSDAPAEVASVPTVRHAPDSAWADALLFDPAGGDGARGRLEELPDEYLAITDVLLEGDDA